MASNNRLLIDIPPAEDSDLTIRTVTQHSIDYANDKNKEFSPFYATGDMVSTLAQRLRSEGVEISNQELLILLGKELSDAFGFDIAEFVIERCSNYLSLREEFEQMFAAGMGEKFFEKYSSTFARVYGDIETVFDELSVNLHDQQFDESESRDDKPLDDVWNNWGE